MTPETEVSRETEYKPQRRQYTRGGKAECSKPGCFEPHAKSHRYCRKHKNEANKIYWNTTRKELLALRDAAGNAND